MNTIGDAPTAEALAGLNLPKEVVHAELGTPATIKHEAGPAKKSRDWVLYGIYIMVGGLIAFGGWMVGNHMTTAVMATPAPVAVEFKTGSVKEYGFFRNWLWRNDSDRAIKVSATILTAGDGEKKLIDRKVESRQKNGKVFELVDGSDNVWTLKSTK